VQRADKIVVHAETDVKQAAVRFEDLHARGDVKPDRHPIG
jgi:hypothetical protein